ncbi:SDR family oxidoreductase [Planotetraspora phitsanulokensis]|uniref:Gluconate 5-dehydrogenase n=2 Tax=Planotetraspora phitsanulokensis TaxID=575192 RepID=A0A8J3XCN2_9ACTN|nr:SDR family oxidoreductase [Planotetraspora phitsanulokensis]GII35584.1 gluconate 5-dehydrogenase [Planotetraspora phitsanulokensis]
MNEESEGLPARPLIGRTAVVTGGGRCVGAGVAGLLARAGARVALVGRSEDSLRAVARELPRDTEVIPADLSQPDAPAAVIDAAIRRLGKVNILVNNAGAENFTPSDQLTAQEADELWALNGRAPLLLGGKAAAHMASIGGGSIVNISSVVGSERSIRGQSLYAATKGAVDAITRSLAADWGGKGVRVNAVRPAVTRSDMSAAIFTNPDLKNALTAQYALGRLGEPEDIAQAVLFFASDASSYVTGQTLSVDGGWISALVH